MSNPWLAILAWVGLLGWFLAAAGWGTLFLNLFELGGLGFWGRLALGLGLGQALLSYLIFLLGACSLFTPGWIAGVAGIWMLSGALFWFRPLRPSAVPLEPRTPFSGFERFLLILLGLLALANLLPASTPAVDWDGLAYHLALPKIYLAHHGFIFRPDIVHNLFPQFTEMLYTVGLFTPYAVGAKLIQFGFGLLVVLALIGLGEWAGKRAAGMLAGLFFYAQFLVHIESGAAFIDLATTAYTALGMLAIVRGLGPKRIWKWLYLGLGFLGMAAATKWHGLVLLGIVAVFVGWKVLQDDSFSLKGKFTVLLKVSGCGILPVIPYFWRAWRLGGNPIWPFGFHWLGGRDWNEVAARRAYEAVHGFAGVHTGWRAFFFWPWDLLAHGNKFGVGGAELFGPLAGGVLLLLLWVLAGKELTPAEKNSSLRAWQGWAGFSALLFLMFWAGSSPQVRFILPLFPLGAWVAARGTAGIWEKSSSAGPAGKAVLRTGVLAAGALFLAVHPPVHRDTFYLISQVLGRVPPDEFCARYLEHYPACRFLNQRMRPGERVLLFGENRGFYVNGEYLWSDPTQTVFDYDRLDTPGKMLDRLNALGVSWVLWQENALGDEYVKPIWRDRMSTLLQRHGRRVFGDESCAVYQLNH